MLYGITGACIAGIPLALLLIYQSCYHANLKNQIQYYEIKEAQCLYLKVWTLKEDIAAGEKVTRTKLEKKKEWIPEADVKNLTDIKKITGKKAKVAAKKGTIIYKNMFHEDK